MNTLLEVTSVNSEDIKMVIEHDIKKSTIRFSIGKMTVVMRLSTKINKIFRVVDYDRGFMIIDTNCDEEYIDLEDLMEFVFCDDDYKNKMLDLFLKTKLENIILKEV